MIKAHRVYFVAALLSSLSCLSAARGDPSQTPDFPLRNGDTWVMVGDSITAHRLHTNYIEAYCVTRFPHWTLRFRNSGLASDDVASALSRFDWDVALWRPTVVSIELGMNHTGAGVAGVDAYIQQMRVMSERVRAIGARPIYLSPSPVNDGTASETLAGRNLVLDKLSTALTELAEEQRAPVADQFHSLLDRWAKNKPNEALVRFAEQAEILAARSDVPRRDLLRAWLDEWSGSDIAGRSADLTGYDAIHPGPAGHLTMCVALLRGLHAPELVSRASLGAGGDLEEAVRCRISEIRTEAGGVSFVRLDQSLPMPIADDARSALRVMPEIAELSRWELKLTGLKRGAYVVRIDGVEVARFTSEALARGCDLGTLSEGPVADQCRRVLELIDAKEGLVARFRAASKSLPASPSENAEAELEVIRKQVLDADAAICAAVQPRPHLFVIRPVAP